MRRKIGKNYEVVVSVLLMMLMISSVLAYANVGEYKQDLQNNEMNLIDNKEIVSVTIPVGSYDIRINEDGHEVVAEGFGRLLVPGKPNLPSKIAAVAIPPGTKVVDVTYTTSDGVILPGAYDISPARLPRVIGEENPIIYEKDKQRYNENYESVYGNNEFYPSEAVEFVRSAGYRKYNLVDVRVNPFSYRPISDQLIYYPEITINVNYKYSNNRFDVVRDNIDGAEQIAEEFILNYNQAQQWYPKIKQMEKDLYDFVIITLDSLTSSVVPLVNWEVSKGRTVEVVTTSWIDSNYAGYDLAEKTRNFLRDKYPSSEWGIEDVLIVGHYDDVPMRRCWQDVGYGMPETDYYYAELSLPDDESWDDDKDHRWGESSDSIDFYTEINVGRIPWSDPSTVLSICEKSIAYEQNDDPSYKKNILLLGGFFWNNEPPYYIPVTDNAVLMETKVDQPWFSDWTMTRMYEKNTDCWSSYDCDYPLLHSNVMSVWPSGTFAFVNWAGHGSPVSTHIRGLGSPAFIEADDCPSLNDEYPAIIFADACSNSDTDYLNIGQAMMQQGSIGFLGSTKVAYGCPGWSDPYDGSTQSLDYFFTTYVTSGECTIGAAHQKALRDMYTNGLFSAVYYEMFEWGALWGNPDLEMFLPPLKMSFPDGLPEYIDPFIPTTITVKITEVSDTYIPDSGMLHYRFDGGTFQTTTMTHVSENLYEVTLPGASCGRLPEFYFSAESTSSGEVYNPIDSPASFYSAFIGEHIILYNEDFETDTGWTVENSPGLIDGPWERGDPVGGGDRGDPPTDFDGSGQCYLTDNVDDDFRCR